MGQEKLSEDLLALLKIVNDAGVKKRLRVLSQLGFLNHERAEWEDGKVMARYTVSSDGLKVLRA